MFKNNTGIIQKIRRSRTFRGVSALLLFSLLFEIAQPTVSLALTEGPSQPEVQSFEPINTTQMVDLFSGDFNYNIPLFNLPGPNGGYPVNLAYHAGSTMDDEASWVGLGWNINVGSLVRNVRGLPDEFMSKKVEGTASTADGEHDHLLVQKDMKESWTFGVTGGLHPELFGASINEGQVAANLSASVYYNNYQGLGVSLNPSVSIGRTNAVYTTGLSLDSENGLGVTADVSLRKTHQWEFAAHSLSFSFDGSLSVEYSYSKHKKDIEWDKKLLRFRDVDNVQSYGAGMSFARTGFSPGLAGDINRYNVSLSVKTGVSGLGVFVAGSLGAFFNTEDYSNEDKKGRLRLVGGYSKMGESDMSTHYLRDFSRANDGQITKSSMFLPNSQYTYDIFNSTGQGLSGYFRARRSDVGRSFDPYQYNTSGGLGVTLDFSTQHFGLGVNVNFGWDSQGPWSNQNDFENDFNDPDPEGAQENVYYQAHGEQTILDEHELDYIRGLNLPFVRLKPKSDDGLAGGKRLIDASSYSVPNNEYSASRTPSKRVVRNTLIHDLKNSEVDHLGEFDVRYFTNQSQVYGAPQSTFDRTTRNGVKIGSHPAGYKVLNNEGSYYVYGLPAYNLKETDNLFSVALPGDPANTEFVGTSPISGDDYYKVNGTNDFINKTTKSPYAHSYLLTSVQGADYIDLTNNGPTDDDMGYWVKFNYLQSTANYKWRAPYSGCNYSQGQLWSARDDKASYKYGEKEMWYMAQMETKTHIAVFVMAPRDDMREAQREYNDAASGGDSGMKLTEIRIYDKKNLQANQSNPSAVTPLQRIVFEYASTSNQLCKYVPNATSGNGKLTLTAVYFETNGSTRGSQNKYQFDYGTTSTDNPNYASNSYDSWGGYKPKGSKYEHHSNFPYVNQFNQDWGSDAWEPAYGSDDENETARTLTQNTQNALVSAWCLKKITLPSGGTINIQYESDDYGYVQHKTANQMFKIHKLGDDPGLADNQIYESGPSDNDFFDNGSFDDEKRRRIFFKLEYPISTGTSIAAASQQVYDEYVKPIIQDENGERNLYFKTKMELVQGVYDYVAGYLPLEDVVDMGNSNYNFGVHTSSASGGFYRYGYVTVKASRKKSGGRYDKYHPLALAGWTYLQTNAQMILNNSSDNSEFDALGSDPSANDLVNSLNAIGSMVPTAAANFGAIRPYCKSKNMAKYINLNYSCIRLASPDKKKFGGGHRVKQISITDNWGADTGVPAQTRTYGQSFDYTIHEGTKTISSGVATYEPQAGGDENALKYPIYYFDKQNIVSSNNLFAEGPVNEDLFPGATVGYRRVTVKSLNTAEQMNRHATDTDPAGRTGGVNVHEFYTAKDFPTIVSYSLLSEENSTKDVFNLPIVIPLIGSIKRNYYHGTQAYMIELNDMHGRPKSVETFELNDYEMGINPITSSTYEYQYDVLTYQGETVKKINSEVNVIADQDNQSYTVGTTKRLMGVETDLFTDQRETKTFSMMIGGNFNADIAILPLLSVWPAFTNHKTMFRTYVTNKVIHRSGILKRTKVRDLQTVNESEIVAYDEKSGIPILTKVKNEFGDDFYDYNIPAYYIYDRMGHAYQNINYSFAANLTSGGSNPKCLEFATTTGSEQHLNLVRGDELLITEAPGGTGAYQKVYFLGWKYGSGSNLQAIIHAPYGSVPAGNGYKFRVIRSGNRNQYGGSVANYLTKGRLQDLITTGEIAVDPADNTAQSAKTRNINPESVLAASANIMRDDWSTSIQLDLSNDLITENPFLTGNSGIWRPVKSYTWVGARKTSGSMSNNTSSDPQLKNDGVFLGNVKLFSWDLGNIEDYVSNWEWVNEVTRYSPEAYELENKNRLDVYSSALYGYDNSLSIGVSQNASFNESGVSDFETIKGGGTVGDFMKVMSQTNLNFDNNHSAYSAIQPTLVTEQFTIKKATVQGSKIRLTVAENSTIPADYINSTLQKGNVVGLSLTSRKNGGILGNLGFYFNGQIQAPDGTGDLVIQPFLKRTIPGDQLLPTNGVYHGVITYFIRRRHRAASGSISYVHKNDGGKAHTGKRSMLLSGTSDIEFDQPKLKLKGGKKYILSAWISRSNENVVTFKPGAGNAVKIGKLNTAGTAFENLVNATAITYGKIIEGWQKVDVEFIWDDSNDVPVIAFAPGGGLYVDDVRVSPKTGGIMTYVYDVSRFWLTASLNADNYATLYYYDEQGNLHLKKQETEKGVFTITESRGHVSKNF